MKMKNIVLTTLLATLLVGCSSSRVTSSVGNVSSEEKVNLVDGENVTISVDMPNTEYEVTDDLVNMFSMMGSKNLGFDAKTWLESDMGQWSIGNLQNYLNGIPQDDEKVIEYWKEKGMNKQYFEGDDSIQEWAIYTPVDMDESKEYPVVFVMHMGGTNIYFGESEGFIEDGAKNDYICVLISWSEGNANEKQIKAFEESGMNTYEAYSFKTVYEKVKEIVPVDESRVYCAGFSGGGNACGYIAMECSDLIAGISPATGAMIQSNDASTIESDVAMIMCYGTYDAEERWPIVKDAIELGEGVKLSLQERIDNVNTWNKATGALLTTTLDEVNTFAESNRVNATSVFGLNFDKTYEKEYETTYYFGDICNEDGQTTARYMGVEGCPHFTSCAWASEVYNFFSHFSKNIQTGELVIE